MEVINNDPVALPRGSRGLFHTLSQSVLQKFRVQELMSFEETGDRGPVLGHLKLTAGLYPALSCSAGSGTSSYGEAGRHGELQEIHNFSCPPHG